MNKKRSRIESPPYRVHVHTCAFSKTSFFMKTKLNQLFEAIQSKVNKDITSLEKEVADEIEDAVTCDTFFKLPLENIFSIVSNIEFLED